MILADPLIFNIIYYFLFLNFFVLSPNYFIKEEKKNCLIINLFMNQ